MADKKQYFRNIKPGDVSVEGRQSNGFTADKKGNVIFYSALKDSELDYLAETQNKDDIPLYYGNSYFGVIKSEVHNNLNLGNNNYETLNNKVDANKIITTDPNITGYKTIITTNATITIPNGKTGPISVLVFYPGIAVGGKDGKDYMPPIIKKSLPDFYEKYVIVVPNTDKTAWSNIKSEYEAEVKKANLTTKNISIGIFSGSGNNNRDIQKYLSKIDGMVNFIIMDPWPGSTLKDNVTAIKNKGIKVYMMYNPGEWTSYNTYPSGLKNLLSVVEKNNKDNVVKVTTKHIDIPSEMLTRFKSQIESNLDTTITPQQTQTQPQQQQSLPPKQEEKIPPAAPPPDDEEVTEFIFLEESSPELSPTQLTAFIDTTVNNNEELTIEDLRREKEEEEKIIRREKKKEKIPTGDKVGSIKALIQNNSKDYNNLGDIIYHSTPLYSQSDPEWGSYKSGDLKMSSHGCCYTTICMLLGNATKDASKTTPYSVWNSGKPNTKSVLVYFDNLAGVFGKSIKLTSGSLAGIDNILKTKPVGFEWSSKKGWPKGYNLYKGNKKGNYKGDSKGISYTCCNQHWMVITGKNSDGTYTVFDPAGGVIRKNQSRDQIEAGLERIAYVN
jgi:hypothetical protein